MRKMFSENQIKEIAGSSPEKIIEIVNEGISEGQISVGGALYIYNVQLEGSLSGQYLSKNCFYITNNGEITNQTTLLNDISQKYQESNNYLPMAFSDEVLSVLVNNSSTIAILSSPKYKKASNAFEIVYNTFNYTISGSNIVITRGAGTLSSVSASSVKLIMKIE